MKLTPYLTFELASTTDKDILHIDKLLKKL